MLIDIQVNKEKIQKEIKRIQSYLKEKDEDLSQEEKDIFNNKILSRLKSINTIDDILDRKRQGVYEGRFDIYDFEEYCDINRKNIEQFYSFNYLQKEWTLEALEKSKENYGMADKYQQVMSKYPELKDKDRKFVLIYNEMWRKYESSHGGFRYHKNGKYIGKQKPKCEYFYDDKHIDRIILYHIYEIKI